MKKTLLWLFGVALLSVWWFVRYIWFDSITDFLRTYNIPDYHCIELELIDPDLLPFIQQKWEIIYNDSDPMFNSMLYLFDNNIIRYSKFCYPWRWWCDPEEWKWIKCNVWQKKILWNWYYSVGQNAYFWLIHLSDVDISSFQVTLPTRASWRDRTSNVSDDAVYARDKNNIYYLGKVLSWANAQHFNNLWWWYAVDDRYAYYKWKTMYSGPHYYHDRNINNTETIYLDPASFEYIDYSYAKDKNLIYINWKSNNAKSSDFMFYNAWYRTDWEYVYNMHSLVEWVDPKTFLAPDRPEYY